MTEPMSAENRGATNEVFVNQENDEKMSNGLLGTGAQTCVHFPSSLLLLEDARKPFQKGRNGVQKNCAILDVHSCIESVK